MSLSGAKGCETSPLSLYCHNRSDKQQSQGTGGIFKLAPSNNNNHPHTSASEGETNLFAYDIGKISSLFFSFLFHFFQRACFVPC